MHPHVRINDGQRSHNSPGNSGHCYGNYKSYSDFSVDVYPHQIRHFPILGGASYPETDLGLHKKKPSAY